MFVRQSKQELVIRVLLIAVILFNALAPTAAIAESARIQNDLVDSAKTENSGQPNKAEFVPPTFARPIARVSEASQVFENTALQTSSVLLQCDPSSNLPDPSGNPICPNQPPGISLTETFEKDGGLAASARFRLLCQGGGCEPQDIYYAASIDATYQHRFGDITYYVDLYLDGHFTTTLVQGVQHGYCGTGYSGSCHFEIAGVIPKEIISQNSADWANNYFEFRVSINNEIWYGSCHEAGVIQVSLDRSLISNLLEDMILCGGCGQEAINQIGDPINTRTGALSYPVDDLAIMSPAGPIAFRRTYSSAALDIYGTSLGHGWTHNQDMHLVFPTDTGGTPGFVKLKDFSGNLYRFYDSGYGRYVPYAGVMYSLVKENTTPVTYTVRDANRNTYTLNETGKIISRVDSRDNITTYSYDLSNRLERIHAGSQYLQLSYNAQGQIETVQDFSGRGVSFGYDTQTGDLTSSVDMLGKTWTYTYNATHHLVEVIDPDQKVKVHTDYYTSGDFAGRAWKQYDGEGNLVAELTYSADGTTTITDAFGHPSTDSYNSSGVLDQQAAPLSGITEKTFDNNFRLKTIRDANGASTLLSWSANGANLEYIKDALNNETSISYNSSNNPTSIIDPLDHETKYFYADTNFPTLPTRIEYPLSFDNGVTYIGTNYEYYPPSSGASAGKVKFVTDAQGHQTYYTYTSAGQTATVTTAYNTANALTTTYEYDSLGRLTDVTDEQGIVTHHEYDAAGRLLKATQNYVATRPQNDENKYNLVSEYRYDVRGNQIAVIDTYGVITRTYYDLANRPVAVVQNLVGQTIDAVSPPARGNGLSDENIRMDTVYDEAGNVIATIDPMGIITRTYYDEANRPVTTVQNLTGQDISIATPPSYSPATPDQNIRTDAVYDTNGNVIASLDTEGVITRTYYDALNRPVTVVQHLTGQEISVATPPGRGTSSNLRTDTYYDANGNVIATVDPRNVITRTYYDALNRPITVVQNLSGQGISEPTPPAAGVEANLRSDTYYDEVGNVIATVDPRGVVTRTYYDESNRPVATVQNLVGQSIYVTTPPARGSTAQNIRTDIAYDQDGRRDTSTDPLGRVTKYAYNEVGQVLKVTANYVNGGAPQNDQDQRNIVSEYAYDALGRQTETTDTAGRVTLNAYDDLGRVTSVTQNYLQGQAQNYKDSSGNQYNLITTYAYDVRGNQIAATDTTGVTTRTYYDMAARPVTVVRNLLGQDISISAPPARTTSESENLRTDTVYLGTGSVDYTVDETGATTDYTYDSLGRLITTVDSLSHSTDFEYDANGNRIKMTDAEGVITRYEYDALNRLSAVVENYRAGLDADQATNVRTSYTYDANGNRLSIRDGQSRLEGNDYRTTFTYDALGRLETESDPLGHTTTYQYDALGNRLSLLDANGAATAYGYDELNRLTLIDYPSPDADVTFDYDALGRRQSMNDGLGTTAWDYNNLGLPNSITDPFAASVSYGYDDAGNRTSLTYPDNSVVNYRYNDVNRLTAVTRNQSTVASYQYDPAGRLKEIQRANGVTTSYNYHNNGWLQDMIHSSGATTLSSYEYQYDNVGNRTRAIENVLFPSLPATATPTLTFTPTGITPTDTASVTLSPTGTITESPTPTDTPVTPQGQGRAPSPLNNFMLANFAVPQVPGKAMLAPVYQEEPTETPSPTATDTSIPMVNFALGKAATQSSTYSPGYDASVAVDGNTNGNYVTHTNYDLHAWWQVDLEMSTYISSIELWNRSGMSERLSNYYVFVSDTPFASTDLNDTLNQSGVSNFYQAAQAGFPTTVSINRSGRYVRVQLAGTNYLSLAEVRVLGPTPTVTPTSTITDTPTEGPSPTASVTQTPTLTPVPIVNFALGKAATQSSTYSPGYDASVAVDGNTNGNYVTHTNYDLHAWWQVDLEMSTYISSIELWNRSGMSERLSNYYVFVSDTPFASTDLNDTLNQSGVSNFYQAAQAGFPTTVSINRSGRYVRVQLAGTNYLSLAEVRVLGPASTATPTSTPTLTVTATATITPTFSPTPFVSPTPMPGMNQTVIEYDYDSLYRLTAADYSTGDYYHYSYDAVGNRIQQEKSIIGLVTTDAYVYDDANRLASVNGVNYTWDNNGNLLNDGVNAYTYNAANQLKTMTGPSVAASYAYNGLGDRLQEIANGETTSFIMDYNTGLTQVLNDGTNNYIYGNGRIAQTAGTGTEYFLGDALGSVRQLTNTSGAITYASVYDPYGVTTQSYGVSQSAYGYTGEFTSNEMVYLRARHYVPGMGRFLTRDTWGGNINRPMSYNKWQYTYSNPINLTDPTGNEGVPTWVEEYLEELRDKTEYCYNKGDSLCVWFSYRQLAEFGPLFGYPYASAHLLNFLNKGGDIEYVRSHSKWVLGDPIVKKPLRKATKEMWRLIHSNVQAGITKGHVKTQMRDVGNPQEKSDLWYALGPFSVYIEADYEVSGCYDVEVKPVHHFTDEYDWHPELDLMAAGSIGGLADFKDEWAKSLVPNYAKEYKITGSWFGPNKIYHFSSKWLDWSASNNKYSSWEYSSSLWGIMDIFHFDS